MDSIDSDVSFIDSEDSDTFEEYITGTLRMSDCVKKAYATSFTVIRYISELRTKKKELAVYVSRVRKEFNEKYKNNSKSFQTLTETINAEEKKFLELVKKFDENLTKIPLHLLLVAYHIRVPDINCKYVAKLEAEIISILWNFKRDEENEIIYFGSICNISVSKRYLLEHQSFISMKNLDLLTAYAFYLHMKREGSMTNIALFQCIALSLILDEIEESHVSCVVSVKQTYSQMESCNKDYQHALNEKVLLLILSMSTAITQIFNRAHGFTIDDMIQNIERDCLCEMNESSLQASNEVVIQYENIDSEVESCACEIEFCVCEEVQNVSITAGYNDNELLVEVQGESETENGSFISISTASENEEESQSVEDFIA